MEDEYLLLHYDIVMLHDKPIDLLYHNITGNCIVLFITFRQKGHLVISKLIFFSQSVHH